MPIYKHGHPVTEQQKPLLVFGSGQWAEYSAYVLEHDAGAAIAGFTVDDAYMAGSEFSGKSLVLFSEISRTFPPDEVDVFVSAGFRKNNQLRAARLRDVTSLGYEVVSYVSNRASTWPNLIVNENVAIHEGAIVQPFCKVGANTHILSSANISHHTSIADHTFIAGSVCLAGGVTVGSHCFLGMNSTVIEVCEIGDFVTLGAGSVLTQDAKEPGLYVGSPARLIRPFDPIKKWEP